MTIIKMLPLNDGTRGIRFNILNQKGFARLRTRESRGWFKTNNGNTFNQFHFGKFTVAFEKKRPIQRLGNTW